ncbi:MAG: aldo/keto reductase [Nakamurella sp.]
MSTTAASTEFTLSTGAQIPAIGLGTWPLDDAQVAGTVVAAVEIGYRLIDTAAKYGNEEGVGQGIRDAGVAREKLFVTTKLDGDYQGADRAVAGLEASLSRLGVDYVDLLMIHWPLPDRDLYADTWRTFIRLQECGKARAIGVSNFKQAHLDRLIEQTGVAPAVNQIELDPTLARTALREYNSAHGILTQAWSPLGRGGTLTQPVITGIADRFGKSPAQVILRWHVQLGISAVPKSARPARLAQNLDVFDFDLTADDLEAIAELDRGESAARDSSIEGH